jgi:hypothetical protein
MSKKRFHWQRLDGDINLTRCVSPAGECVREEGKDMQSVRGRMKRIISAKG